MGVSMALHRTAVCASDLCLGVLDFSGVRARRSVSFVVRPTRTMSLSLLSWLLLVLQIALFAVTALVAPMVLRPRLLRYLAYCVIAAVAWLAYAVAAMLFDSKAKIDVPGIGYLLVGFISWLIASIIFGVRA